MTSTEYIPCENRSERRSFYISGEDRFVRTVVDLAEMRRMQTIFSLNVRFGSVDPCRCLSCNPRTDSIDV